MSAAEDLSNVINQPKPRTSRVGYRVKRVTAMLILSSVAAREIQDPKLHRALEKFRASNFNFDVLDDRTLNVIYSYVDAEIAQRAADEFTFIPAAGNIINLGSCIGTCELCGKGDSRDDGLNEDKLQYQFRLINKAGGHDLLVGSSCITHHGLHVDGAATVEDAERILRRTLAQHIRRWKIDQWRALHPDHELIDFHYRTLMRYSSLIEVDSAYYPRETLDLWWGCLGLSRDKMRGQLYSLSRARRGDTMKSAASFYQRAGYLTEGKTEAWMEAKRVLAEAIWAKKSVEEGLAAGYVGETMLDHLGKCETERNEKRAKRKPREL